MEDRDALFAATGGLRAVARRPVARALALGSLLAVLLTVPRRGADETERPPDEGGRIESMGQPRSHAVRRPLGGCLRPADGNDAAPAGQLHLGLFKPITSPIAAIGIAGEGYVGARGSSADGGVRALGVLRPFGLAVGVDYDIAENEADPIVSWMRAFKRGGLFGLGGMFRFNYLPTRDHTFSVGYQIPLGEGWVGRTRPKTDHVKLLVPASDPRRRPRR
jgi:hypothetical protein